MFDGIGDLFNAMVWLIVVLALGLIILVVSLFCLWLTSRIHFGSDYVNIGEGTRGDQPAKVEAAMQEVWVDEYQLHQVRETGDDEYVTWRNGNWYHIRRVDSPFLDTLGD